MNQFLGNVVYRHRDIDPELVDELCRLECALLVERTSEEVNAVAREAEPGREWVAAELREQRRHFSETIRHRIGVNASAGAFRHERAIFGILCVRDDEGRTVVALAEATGDDAGETLVQFRQIHNKHLIRCVLCFDLLESLLRGIDRHFLPDIVQRLQLHCLREGLRRIRRGKE